MNDIELALRMTADASDVSSAFDAAGSSALDFASDVDEASRKADQASGRLDNVGASAENLDDKASKATGALGALSAGAELVGMEGLASGMQSAAMATDFMSGVGQSLNLVLELQIVQSARARAAAIGQAVAARTVSAVNKAWAVTQWAVNAAMSANPVGLVVLAVLALVAAVVIAYKRSERFRAIVQAVMKAASAAWSAFSGVVSSVVENVVGYVSNFRDKASAAWSLIRERGGAAFQSVRDKVTSVMDSARDKVTAVKERIVDSASAMGTGLKNAFEAAVAPIKALIEWVDDLINKIKNIDFPKLPDVNPFRAVAGGRVPIGAAGREATAGGVTQHFTIQVNGVLDTDAAAKSIQRIIDRAAERRGY